MKKLILLFCIPLIFLLYSCGNNKVKLNDNFMITINNQNITISNNETIYLKELSIENGILITADEKYTICLTYHDSNTSKNIVLSQAFLDAILSPYSYIAVRIEDDYNNILNATIYLAPNDLPQYETQGESVGGKDYYFTTYNSKYDGKNGQINYLMKISSTGKLLYYKKIAGELYDFQKVITTDNKIRYIYMVSDRTLFNFNDFGVNSTLVYCKAVVLDENYNLVQEIVFDYGNGKINGVEMHDILYFNDNHYILCTNEAVILQGDEIPSYIAHESDDKMYIVDCILQEVKNGEILWSFHSKDYEDMYAYYSTNILDYQTYQDYMHFNSLCLSNDNNLLVSFRNISAIMKINRTNGERMWLLGGSGDDFGLNDSFGHQHEVTHLKNGNILIYDNGKFGEVDTSRILEIKLDEENMLAKIVKSYNVDYFSYSMGSVQKLEEFADDVYVYCYGNPVPTQALFEEKNFSTGNINFRLKLLTSRIMYNVNYC